MVDPPPSTPLPLWRRRHCCAALLGSLLLGTDSAGAQTPPALLPHPRDFAAILNLKSGQLQWILQAEQAERIRTQPGSLLKLATAAAALTLGKTTSTRRIACPGWYQLPAQLGGQRLPCWDHRGHGSLTVVEAIAQSCNVHFYTLATELGSRQVLAGLHRFGIGLDLHSGMAALLATGQDPRLTVDPWQLLHLISSIALRGKGILTQTIAPIDLPSHTWDLLWVGMSKAVTEGTCRSLAPAGISVAAKTGTVLNSQLLSHPLGAAAPIQAEDFQAWLGAFWPLDDPDWAMVMYVHQGKAYEAAIPIARKLIAWVSATAQS